MEAVVVPMGARSLFDNLKNIQLLVFPVWDCMEVELNLVWS